MFRPIPHFNQGFLPQNLSPFCPSSAAAVMASAPQSMAGDALRVADLPGRGRALLAARNILEGEVLLSEPPILLYPSSLASLPSYCSACFRSLPAPPHTPCPSCRAAAFCSPSCAAASHPRLVCAALSSGLAAAPEEHQEPLLFLLFAYSLQEPSLRALLSLSSAPRGPSPSQQQDAASLHAMLASLAPPHMLPAGFSPDLTAALLSKDRTNSFSIMEPYRPDVPLELRKTRAYAVYPRASLLNHDCLPNSCHFDYVDRPGPGNTDIVVRALHGISEGREVCISYFAANWRYADRQRRLLEDYGFKCECERCQIESKWKLDDDNDGDDEDDTMEEEDVKEDVGDGDDDGMQQEEGSDGADDDFPHAFFFVRYLCDREDCYGMLAPLPPLPNGDLSHVFECNACGQLKKEEDVGEPDAGDSNMVN